MPIESTSSAKSSSTQAKRRALYGLNVLVAAVAVVGIVILINWIIAWRYDALPPTVKQYVRYDLTATRAYSLSPQTLKVLGNLDGERKIVTLFHGGSAALDRVRDLIDEYERYGPQISVQHIDPRYDVTKRDAFFNDVKSLYEEQLKPAEEAIPTALTTLAELKEAFTQTEAAMTTLLRDESLQDPTSLQLIRTLATRAQEAQSVLQSQDEMISAELGHSLPGYRDTVQQAQLTLDQMTKLLDAAVAAMTRTVDKASVDSGVKEALLTASEHLKEVSKKATQAIETLDAIEPVEAYERARATLLSSETVAVMSSDKIQVLPVNDLFREIDAQTAAEEGQTEMPFIGEERITGALVSLDQKTKPLVVFMLAMPGRATGPNGQFEYVAQRLRAANMDVQEWNAVGTPTQFGQTIPPGPLPTPEEGQPATYIVLPVMETGDPNMMMMTSQAKQQVAENLRKRLEAGDSAMILLAQNFAAQYGAANPIVDVLHDWGITPQLDRVVLRERQTDERRKVAVSQSEVTDWPADTPIGSAMRGQRVMFLQTSPLSLDDGAAKEAGITHHKLVELRQPQLWSQVGLSSPEEMRNAKYNPEEGAAAFLIAAASENDKARLITFAAPVWATDDITTYGTSLFRQGPGAALDPGGVAALPGNTELFVNSVYWLSRMDHLIAAGARTQDIRRIEPMSDQQLTTYRTVLLAGMPAAALLAGIVVYFVRRRA